MADPAAVLIAAVETHAAADAGVIAAFAGAPIRTYRIAPKNPPTGTGKPYAILWATVTPDPAQCFDSAETEVVVDLWGFDPIQVMAIAAAFAAMMVPPGDDGTPGAPDWALAGHTLTEAAHVSTTHLADPRDGSAHSVVRVRFGTDAA